MSPSCSRASPSPDLDRLTTELEGAARRRMDLVVLHTAAPRFAHEASATRGLLFCRDEAVSRLKSWLPAPRAPPNLISAWKYPRRCRRQPVSSLRCGGFVRGWDSTARAPYLWNAESGRFISYDDPQSLTEQAKFVKALGLGRITYWEQSYDPEEILLHAIFYNLR